MMLTKQIIQKIIEKLLKGEDYRIAIINLINVGFLQFAINFFKKIVAAKLENRDITADWYKKTFLNSTLSAKEIAIHSGLNRKTIHNMFNSSKKEIVLDAADAHYASLYKSIKDLVDTEPDLELSLTIKFQDVSVDLNINESLIVINTLAVKRAELRGGLWSTAGKRVEKPLMQTLCKLYSVSDQQYAQKIRNKNTKKDEFEREIDFYLISGNDQHKCEVKLMGKGNPESADAVIARNSKVFIADKLSDTNKKQLDRLNIEWVELRNAGGFKRFKTVLTNLNIPHKEPPKNFDKELKTIFKEIIWIN